MPSIPISEELKAVIDMAVREGEYTDAAEYIARLVRQDQKRRAKEELHARVLGSIQTEEITAEAWQKMQLGNTRRGRSE